MKKYVGIILILLCGCQQPLEVVVTPVEQPIKIRKDGCFVTKQEFIKLINGEKIKYYNGRTNKYYIPSNLIDIKDGYVTLKKVEGE